MIWIYGKEVHGMWVPGVSLNTEGGDGPHVVYPALENSQIKPEIPCSHQQILRWGCVGRNHVVIGRITNLTPVLPPSTSFFFSGKVLEGPCSLTGNQKNLLAVAICPTWRFLIKSWCAFSPFTNFSLLILRRIFPFPSVRISRGCKFPVLRLEDLECHHRGSSKAGLFRWQWMAFQNRTWRHFSFPWMMFLSIEKSSPLVPLYLCSTAFSPGLWRKPVCPSVLATFYSGSCGFLCNQNTLGNGQLRGWRED